MVAYYIRTAVSQPLQKELRTLVLKTDDEAALRAVEKTIKLYADMEKRLKKE